MVRFEHDSYVIEVHTGGNPVESWMKLHEEISYLISLVDQNNCPEDGFAYLPPVARGHDAFMGNGPQDDRTLSHSR